MLAEAALGVVHPADAQAGGVDAGAPATGDPRPQDGLLRGLAHVLQHDHRAGVEHVAQALEDPHHRQVALAADVDAGIQLARVAFDDVPGRVLGIFAAGNQVVFQECHVVVGRDAHVFLQERFLIHATGLDEVVVGRFVHRLPFVVLGQLLLQLVEQPLVERVFQRDPVQADALRVAAFAHFADQLIEEVVAAAVGAEHLQAAAPGDAGIGNGPQLARVFVQGEFVQHAAAALAGLRVRVGRHAVDVAAVGKAQVEAGLLAIQHLLAEIARTDGQHIRPQLAVVDEQPGLHLVAAADPLVIARALHGRAPHARIGGRP